ncbi:MAG: phosphate acyltransferase PlsX [Alphaproteobacteria bacterium]|nr:phosphate acyltransferase PlsX [Alphaproteobacteria bacterium]
MSTAGQPLVIALDAMGGDQAPDMVIAGIDLLRGRHPDVRFLLFGDEPTLTGLLAKYPRVADAVTVRHAASVVLGEDKPSTALRQRRDSSMRLAIEAVHKGDAAGVVSAGNTGALMAMAKVVLRTMAGIDRPAICSKLVSQRGPYVMLDLGANIECSAENLVQFAVMGEVFARLLLGIERPSVGILNVGVEELKGNERVQAAAARLRDGTLPIDFRGFVEGTEMMAGAVDVVVTDGFTGNVALKVLEGTVKMYSQFLRQAFASSWLNRVGYLFVRGAIGALRRKFDPRLYNGGMLVGLNGIVVKSHGGTDALGFSTAVEFAIGLAAQGYNRQVMEELSRAFPGPPAKPATAAGA